VVGNEGDWLGFDVGWRVGDKVLEMKGKVQENGLRFNNTMNS
jgi:hypothetical protein